MPIKPENKKLYPPDWREIRERIIKRANNCCESCGVPNYALGYRDAAGAFHPADEEWTGFTDWWADAAAGRLTFKEVAKVAALVNEHREGLGPNKERAIVIVLTLAHLDHGLTDHSDENLRLLCQRCHLRYDHRQHRESARQTRMQKADQLRGLWELTL
jgi:5-methylcytosine-specific restriction endonuclease McrA